MSRAAAPTWRLLLMGNFKAVTAGLSGLFFALATGAVDDGLSLAEVLFALAALLGGGALTRQIRNTGPLANATEVPLVGPVVDALDGEEGR